MTVTEIKFELSDSILHSLNQNQAEFVQEMRLLTALQLFKSHKLSFGQAAELAGLSKAHFLTALDTHQIDLIAYPAVELEAEMGYFQK